MNGKRIFAGTAAVLAAGVALAPAVASAAPQDDRVPGTQCTVGQVERATNAVAPEAIALVNNTPNGRAQAYKLLTSAPQQREATIMQLAKDNPQAAAYYRANQASIDGKIAKVISTCSKY